MSDEFFVTEAEKRGFPTMRRDPVGLLAEELFRLADGAAAGKGYAHVP